MPVLGSNDFGERLLKIYIEWKFLISDANLKKREFYNSAGISGLYIIRGLILDPNYLFNLGREGVMYTFKGLIITSLTQD